MTQLKMSSFIFGCVIIAIQLNSLSAQSWSNSGNCPNSCCPPKKTFYLGVDKKAPNAEAIQLCQSRFMQLASIQTEEDNLAVYKLLQESSLEVQSIWTSGNKLADGKTWRWLHGERVLYFSWLPGEPNNWGGDETCIDVNKRDYFVGWNDRPCLTPLYYICERVEQAACCSNSQPTVNVYVNNNAISQNGNNKDQCSITADPKKKKTYYLGVDTKATNAEAIKLCQARSMQLVSIQTKEKNLEVFKLLQNSSLEPQELWTSGNRLADGKTWRWLKGEQVLYFNWMPGDPNNWGGNEACIDVIKRDNDAPWYDRACDMKFYYICESVDDVPCNRQLIGGNTQCPCQSIVNY